MELYLTPVGKIIQHLAVRYAVSSGQPEVTNSFRLISECIVVASRRFPGVIPYI